MDRNARFDALVEAAGPVLLAVLCRIVRDRGVAEELLQDVLLLAWRRLDAFEPGRDPVPYLRAVAVNRAIDHLRRQARRAAPLGDAPLAGVAAPAERGGTIDERLGALSEHERLAVILYYQENRSVAEIAVLLGAAESAVKVRLHRARARLRAAWEKKHSEARP